MLLASDRAFRRFVGHRSGHRRLIDSSTTVSTSFSVLSFPDSIHFLWFSVFPGVLCGRVAGFPVIWEDPKRVGIVLHIS